MKLTICTTDSTQTIENVNVKDVTWTVEGELFVVKVAARTYVVPLAILRLFAIEGD